MTNTDNARAARIEWTVTRQEFARIAAAMVAQIADPSDSSDWFTFTVTAETNDPGDGIVAWFGNAVSDSSGANVCDIRVSDMADLDAETERYEDARAARIESSYLGGR